jgi:hypothetical protein
MRRSSCLVAYMCIKQHVCHGSFIIAQRVMLTAVKRTYRRKR